MEAPTLAATERALRPQRFADVIGQDAIIERLSIRLRAAKSRGWPMEHVLLSGPPGLGKTTLSLVIANEIGAAAHLVNAPAISTGEELLSVLMRVKKFDVLFIDEIHRLSAAIEEMLYPALEDFRCQLVMGEGAAASVVNFPLPPFTLVGATTQSGAITPPMRSRFGIHEHLELYAPDALHQILSANAVKLNAPADDAALRMLAERSRGTPRIANNQLRAAWDVATVLGDGRISAELAERSLTMQAIDSLGLSRLDRVYLGCILREYDGGPVGVEALAATIGETTSTLTDVIEPYCLRSGLVRRTRAGRMTTEKTRAHLEGRP